MEEYIDKILRRDIQLKLDKIQNNPGFYENRRKCVSKELREMGDVYSFWIENPELRRKILRKSDKTLKREARRGIQSVNNGWCYLNNPNLSENFIYKISENNFQVAKSVNSLVLGGSAKPFNLFRNSPVTLNCLGYLPPGNAEKIQRRLNETNERVLETYEKDPLTAAIMWHLEGSAIQPFFDGNKRTFRSIQDRILADNNIPPAIIPAGEGRYYHDVFCQALPAYKARDVQGQQGFYNFCASKINNALDDIIGDLGVPLRCSGV